MGKLDHRKGLALLETMIVFLFIGILAGCDNTSGTNPSSSNTTARNFVVVTKQWEAKQILRQIYMMEQAYREVHGTYWPNGATATASLDYPRFPTLGITVSPFTLYTYSISGSPTTFIASATSTVLDEDATLDVWTINDLGQLIVVFNDAAD